MNHPPPWCPPVADRSGRGAPFHFFEVLEQQSMEYCIIFKDCSEFLPSQELLEGYPIDKVPLAVHVPVNPESAVPEGAFAGVPRLRHVSVESGIRLIGPEAWHSCRQLRIVKLPSTVVSISDNAFRSCKLLNSVTAPGCREFGYKAFDECCSLQWVHTTEGIANRFSSCTKFGHYLFRGCINLACKRVPPQASCRRNPLPGNWP